MSGKSLALTMYGDVEKELTKLFKYFSNSRSHLTYQGVEHPVSFWCVWTMRVILRSGLGLVMLKKSIYSQDLFTCRDEFSKEYPVLAIYMHKAFELALHPTNKREDVIYFLEAFLPKYLALWAPIINKK
jgi:hypothetical protein